MADSISSTRGNVSSSRVALGRQTRHVGISSSVRSVAAISVLDEKVGNISAWDNLTLCVSMARRDKLEMAKRRFLIETHVQVGIVARTSVVDPVKDGLLAVAVEVELDAHFVLTGVVSTE